MSSSSASLPLRLPRPRLATGLWSSVARRPELLALLVLAAVLNLWALSRNGFANEYYAAAVRSMSTSWHAFLYGSFDQGGVMTVDKPPLALWVQALSVRMFGYSSWSMLVPQALMGVATVGLSYDMVRRWFGRVAGTVAGLVLVLTPTMVAVSRHNNPDALLALCCVGALWCLVRGLEDGRTRWLVLSGVCVGLGFETKMAAALMVVPAIAAAWLWVAPGRRTADDGGSGLAAGRTSDGGETGVAPGRTADRGEPRLAARTTDRGEPRVAPGPTSDGGGSRVARHPRLVALRQLLAGGLAMVVVGGAWPLLVALTPVADRPWVSGTADNSIWSLILGYNGLGRIFGQAGGPAGGGGPGGAGGPGGGGGFFGGEPGPLRLLNASLGGQGGWLLGFATVAAIGLLVMTRLRRADARTGWLIAIGGTFAVTALAFSQASGIFHPYYVSQLAPFAAMLCGAGAGLIFRGDRAARWLAPLAIAGGVLTEVVVLHNNPGQLSWLPAVLIAGGLAAALALGAGAVAGKVRAIVLASILGLLLLAPATWAVQTLGHATSGTFPAGGPAWVAMGGLGGGGGPGGGGPGGGPAGGRPPGGFAGAPPAGAPTFAPSQGSATTAPGISPGGAGGGGMFGDDTSSLNAAVTYAKQHGGGTIAVSSQSGAAGSLITAGANVAAIGGFSGRESEVSVAWLADAVQDGRIRWVVTSGGGPGGMRDGRTGSMTAISAVAAACTPVSTVDSLYDCAQSASALRART